MLAKFTATVSNPPGAYHCLFHKTSELARRLRVIVAGRKWVRPLCLALLILLSWRGTQSLLQNDIDTNRQVNIHGQNLLTAFFNEHPAADLGDGQWPESQALIRGFKKDDDYGNLVYLGEIYLYRAGDEQVAEELFTRATSKSNSGTCPHQGLGIIYMRSGNYLSALKHKELFIANANINGPQRPAVIRALWGVLRLCRRVGLVDRAAHYAQMLSEQVTNPRDRMLSGIYLGAITLNFDRKPLRRNSLLNRSDRSGLNLRHSQKELSRS